MYTLYRAYKADAKCVYINFYILNRDSQIFFIELDLFIGVVSRTDFMLAALSVIP